MTDKERQELDARRGLANELTYTAKLLVESINKIAGVVEALGSVATALIPPPQSEAAVSEAPPTEGGSDG